MGSRAVIVLCRDEHAARTRFGVTDGEAGVCYTRTGRRFFDSSDLERGLFARIRAAADGARAWDELGTDWLCLDSEIMPWSAKAQDLLRHQYAAVGAAASASLSAAAGVTESTANGAGAQLEPLSRRLREREALVRKYVAAYRRYCWPVDRLEDLRVAPFHLLASEGRVHHDKPHTWHMEMLGRLCEAGAPLLHATAYRSVDVTDDASMSDCVRWWEDLTGRGGEGMVVKPAAFVARGRRGVAQPALKCRGPEYLRIIYGPAYSLSEHRTRLRERGLSAKRSLAFR